MPADRLAGTPLIMKGRFPPTPTVWGARNDGTARSPDDRDLLRACGRGEQAALEQLHRRHARAAHAFALRICGHAADAEDAVSEAFFEMWRTAARFDARSSVRTWLFGIVRHKALDALRRRNPNGEQETLDEASADCIDDTPTPLEQLIEQQHAELLLDCFDRLPEPQREALHLALVEDMRLRDIAIIQRVPENTVATRIHHAKRKLKACVAAALGMKKTDSRDDSAT